jgi:hypothetical protein
MADNLTPTGRQAEVWLQVPESGFLTSFGFFGQNFFVYFLFFVISIHN